jgi:hypothetical protein
MGAQCYVPYLRTLKIFLIARLRNALERSNDLAEKQTRDITNTGDSRQEERS